ncbi:unnamed protein product [Effrenium voratum]|nr:unnamed protein product [Effrenium voratum]
MGLSRAAAARRLVFAAPAVGAIVLALKARYVTPEQHSGFLAIWCLGPVRFLKAVPWRLEFLYKLLPLLKLRGAQTFAHWKSRPDDVIVAVPAKSGTTMMLQMAHQLRVRGAWGGDFDFDDQMDVIPILEGGPAALLASNDINKEQVAHPRIYKSHLRFKSCPAVKRVYCFRDLKDGRTLYEVSRAFGQAWTAGLVAILGSSILKISSATPCATLEEAWGCVGGT